MNARKITLAKYKGEDMKKVITKLLVLCICFSICIVSVALTGCGEKEVVAKELSDYVYTDNGDGTYTISGIKIEGKLVEANIPNGVTTIKGYTFYKRKDLKKVTLSDSVTKIESEAFHICSSLEYNKHEGGYYLSSGDNSYYALIYFPAYERTSGDTEYKINKDTKVLADGAFDAANNLTSIIVDETSSAFKTVNGALYSKDGTTLIKYPSAKESTSFEIPNGVTAIEAGAFSNNTNITTVVIPSSVTFIGRQAFIGCSLLSSVTIENANGWKQYDSLGGNGTDIEMTDAARVAETLKAVNTDYYYKRG